MNRLPLYGGAELSLHGKQIERVRTNGLALQRVDLKCGSWVTAHAISETVLGEFKGHGQLVISRPGRPDYSQLKGDFTLVDPPVGVRWHEKEPVLDPEDLIFDPFRIEFRDGSFVGSNKGAAELDFRGNGTLLLERHFEMRDDEFEARMGALVESYQLHSGRMAVLVAANS